MKRFHVVMYMSLTNWLNMLFSGAFIICANELDGNP